VKGKSSGAHQLAGAVFPETRNQETAKASFRTPKGRFHGVGGFTYLVASQMGTGKP